MVQVPVSDKISVTPALFCLSAPLGQLQRIGGSNAGFNNLGGLVKTTFKF